MKDRLLHEIIREVQDGGDYYASLESLKTAFECDGEQILCVKERLLLWAVENRIIYVYKEVDQKTMVRFFVRGRDS